MKKLFLIGLILSLIVSVAFAEEAATVAAGETKSEEVKAEEAIGAPQAVAQEQIAVTETAKNEAVQKTDEEVIKSEDIQKTDEAKDVQLVSPDKA